MTDQFQFLGLCQKCQVCMVALFQRQTLFCHCTQQAANSGVCVLYIINRILRGLFHSQIQVKFEVGICLSGVEKEPCRIQRNFIQQCHQCDRLAAALGQLDNFAVTEVAIETAKTAETFGIDPKVAMLSFSTKGSGKGGTVALSHDATVIAKELAPELKLDGEMQFDAAVSPVVGQLKFPGSPVAGHANTFIFPCIEAGNIGYKIAQRLGGFAAYGPILQGLNAPINDLSRGCDAEEVYQMSIITAALA